MRVAVVQMSSTDDVGANLGGGGEVGRAGGRPGRRAGRVARELRVPAPRRHRGSPARSRSRARSSGRCARGRRDTGSGSSAVPFTRRLRARRASTTPASRSRRTARSRRSTARSTSSTSTSRRKAARSTANRNASRPGPSWRPSRHRRASSVSRSATTSGFPSCIAVSRRAARAFSACPPHSRARPAATTGRCCCAPARSRTSASSWRPRSAANTPAADSATAAR